MHRDSFVFYRSFGEALKELDIQTRAVCYEAIMEYALNGVEIELTGIAKAIFLLIKPQIDANNQRFENGRKGGRPKKTETKPNNNQTKTNGFDFENRNVTEIKPNVNVNVNENVNVINKEAKRKTFCPPTLEEVQAYCKERNNNVDAQTFIDFYSAKNWMIGKSKMSDWKAAVRTWERRDKETPRNNFVAINSHYTREDMDELERMLVDN